MSDRLKALATLTRVRDRALSEKSAELARLQTDLARIGETRAELQRMRVEECRVNMVEAMPYIAGFMATIGREDDRAAVVEAQAKDLVEKKREDVLESWKDHRSAELLHDRTRDNIRAEEARKDALETDELNIIAFGRKHRFSG